MRILRARIFNYKGFTDTGEIFLQAGLNVVVGPNDSGKSALLEALSLTASSRPHRSLVTAATANTQLEPHSRIKLDVEVSETEANSVLSNFARCMVPAPSGVATADVDEKVYRAATGGGVLSYDIQFTNNILNSVDFQGNESTPVMQWANINNRGAPYSWDPEFAGLQGKNAASSTELLFPWIRSKIYFFVAERQRMGECGVNENRIDLAPNGVNLAAVLNDLNTRNKERYERLVRHVCTVFPGIRWISTTTSSGVVKVKVWRVGTETERDDLAVDLAESGTGIAQVLAILFVAVTADGDRTILIDEPQSYLHPGATKRLFEILRTYERHQYIVSTHTPMTVSGPRSAKLLRVNRDGDISGVTTIDSANQADLHLLLADLGASASDVFGADRILWVEGKTEEYCIPPIARKANPLGLLGVQCVAVHSTADLAEPRRRAAITEKIFSIYDRFSSATTLLPKSAAFLFDREGLTGAEQQAISARANGRVFWLSRRMFENFLLDKDAIATLLAGALPSENPASIASAVSASFDQWASDRSVFIDSEDVPTPNSDDWLKNIHGAKFLSAVFSDASDNRVAYDKVVHGVALTTLLLEWDASRFSEITQQLDEILWSRAPEGNTSPNDRRE